MTPLRIQSTVFLPITRRGLSRLMPGSFLGGVDTNGNRHIFEEIFGKTRREEGEYRKRFAEVFGKSLDNVYGKVIEALIKKGLLEDNTDGVCLTKLGMKYGNQVFQEFLL